MNFFISKFWNEILKKTARFPIPQHSENGKFLANFTEIQASFKSLSTIRVVPYAATDGPRHS